MNREYWSNVARVSGGVIAGQAIGILGYLFLTWLFQPKDFGTYASWLAVVAIGSIFSTGALETSLVRDSDGASRRDAAAKIVGVAVAGSILYGLCCGVALGIAPRLLEGDRLLLGLSIPIATFAMACGAVLQSWAAAEGLFVALTKMRVVQSTLIMLLPLLFSLSGRSAAHLIIGHMLGLVVANLAWFRVFDTDGLYWGNLWCWKGLLRQRRRCFIYVLPALMVGALVGNLPQLFVNSRFGSVAAGHLALAQRVMGVPLSLVGVAVRDVFKRYAGVAYRDRGNCEKEFWNSFLVLSVISICFGSVMLLFGEQLFVLVFGENWREAGRVAVWLMPLFAVGLVASPLTYLIYIVQREDFDVYWQSALLAMVTLVLSLSNDLESMIKTYAACYTLMYVLYLYSCARFARGERAGKPRSLFR